MTDPSGSTGGVFDHERLKGELGTTFYLAVNGQRLPVTLVEVTDSKSGGGFQRFSVLFHGPPDRALVQGTYALQHDVLGSLDIFIVPVIGSGPERMVYEACFNQPLDSSRAT
jgi:hypothetical protein